MTVHMFNSREYGSITAIKSSQSTVPCSCSGREHQISLLFHLAFPLFPFHLAQAPTVQTNVHTLNLSPTQMSEGANCFLNVRLQLQNIK